nr:glycosyltransferase [Chloroflexota bacterium]
MNILFLTQVLPYPLDAGAKVRAYYTLRHLAERHGVTLLSFVRDSDCAESIEALKAVCARVETVPMRRSRLRDGWALARSAATGEPFLIARDSVPEMYRAVRGLMAQQRYEAVHADQLWMAPYALAARAEARRHGDSPRLVLDQHNAVHLIPQRMALSAGNGLARAGFKREAGRMAAYEAQCCARFDRVVAVTAEDREALLGLYRNGSRPASFPVIPICIEADAAVAPRRAGEAGILFLGGMHWPPNADGVRWFAREMLPEVGRRAPGATFFAVGRDAPTDLPAGLPIVAPGYVDDAQSYWDRSGVFVVPLRAGGGMRVKILDAWSRGVPVVSTTVGAEGIVCRPGEDIMIADTPQAFAEAVAAVLSDAALHERLSREGLRTVRARYDWRTVYSAWDEIYEST